MSFTTSSQNGFDEMDQRSKQSVEPLTFGIEYLDQATIGIFPGDLILIGAPAGVGKTQLCCNLALKNTMRGKSVHYFALEAEQYEIERRIKYQMIAREYFKLAKRPELPSPLNYPEWYLGRFYKQLVEIETKISVEFHEKTKGLSVFYKANKFGHTELIEQTLAIAKKTDLIIIDHVHYFDLDDDNELRALREIAKTARTLALEEQKPIVLIAHLRKRDRNNKALVADMDEFHGTSDLYKIATKVVTFAGGAPTTDGRFETFFRVPKNRLNGGVTRYIGRVMFDPKETIYDEKYRIGLADQEKADGFKSLDAGDVPTWVKRQSLLGGSDNADVERRPANSTNGRGQSTGKTVHRPYRED